MSRAPGMHRHGSVLGGVIHGHRQFVVQPRITTSLRLARIIPFCHSSLLVKGQLDDKGGSLLNVLYRVNRAAMLLDDSFTDRPVRRSD
ncbi:MAG: hypothetical protein WCO89_12040 [Syntrophus sp. (in: bacteria)]